MSTRNNLDELALVSLKAFDASIERGISDANAGRLKSAAEVFDRLEAKYRAMVASPRSEQSKQHLDS